MESQPTAALAFTALTSASEIVKTDQAFHHEKSFLQQIPLIYCLPLTDVHKLLHNPLLKGSREVQVLSQQCIPNTHRPEFPHTLLAVFPAKQETDLAQEK